MTPSGDSYRLPAEAAAERSGSGAGGIASTGVSASNSRDEAHARATVAPERLHPCPDCGELTGGEPGWRCGRCLAARMRDYLAGAGQSGSRPCVECGGIGCVKVAAFSNPDEPGPAAPCPRCGGSSGAPLVEWQAEVERRGGLDCKFVCPKCGLASSPRDFIAIGANAGRPAQECIGRYTKERGCDFAAFGLFRGPEFVAMPNGDKIPVFAFAEVGSA